MRSRRDNRIFLASSFALGSLGVLSGCQSQKHIVLESRPAWMMQAERQLEQDGQRNMSVEGAGARRMAGGSGRAGRKAAATSTQAETTATGGSQANQGVEGSRGASDAANRAAMPTGVQWSETKVSVEVED